MLSGRTVLIVEAQYLIALDLQNTLDPLDPAKVVIAQNPADARESAEDWDELALAIVEVERELPEHIALIGELLRKDIPVIGLTADADLQQHLNWFTGTPLLLKPAPSERTLALIAQVIDTQKE